MARLSSTMALATLAIAGTAAAQTAATPAATPTPSAGGGLADKLVNVPGSDWNVYGQGQSVTRLEKDGPQGYPAIRVSVPAKAKNAYDIGALSPTTKPIAQGDTVLVAVYLRAPNLKDGETTSVPFVGVNKGAAPYDTIATGTASVSNQWKVYFGSGKSPAAYAAGGAQASLHLAADKHVIDLGPVRIYDLGPNVDPARLPRN